jgi:hypothetical protein
MALQERFKPSPQKWTAVRAAPYPSKGRGEAHSFNFRHFNMLAVPTGRALNNTIAIYCNH